MWYFQSCIEDQSERDHPSEQCGNRTGPKGHSANNSQIHILLQCTWDTEYFPMSHQKPTIDILKSNEM